MALPSFCDRISREPEIDWQLLEENSYGPTERRDKSSNVIGTLREAREERRDKGPDAAPFFYGVMRARQTAPVSAHYQQVRSHALAVSFSPPEEHVAESLWSTVDTLRETERAEQAEDYLILRLANWVEEQEFELVRRVFDFAAVDCLRLLNEPYDDSSDERISTYAVVLGLTRSLRSKLGGSWVTLHRCAFDVVAHGQGPEIASRVLGNPG